MTRGMVVEDKRKPPNPRPWMEVDPEPLPAEDADLLEQVYEYAEMLASAESRADSVAMAKAEALERLYQRGTWAEEWNRARPPKPDAIGRPVDPLSRNRFAQWQAWRAEKERRRSLPSRRVYQLLNARAVASYLNGRTKKAATEFAIRPLSWMLTHGHAERIPEVETIAVQIADGGPITDRVMRKALSEWKAKNLSRRDLDRGKQQARSRPLRKRAEDEFGALLKQDPAEAREFIKWAADQLREAAKQKLQVVS